MNKKIILPIFLLLVILMVLGYWRWATVNAEKKEQIVQKAEEVGKKYFQEHYNVDVEFTSNDIVSGYIGNDIGLHGYIKTDKDETVFVLINYRTREVVTAQVSDALLQKRISPK